MAMGDVQIAARDGRQVPPGTGLDADGNASNDPAAIAKGVLLPFGGYKGSAIALMVELLAAGPPRAVQPSAQLLSLYSRRTVVARLWQ